jgi:hypothetical protein
MTPRQVRQFHAKNHRQSDFSTGCLPGGRRTGAREKYFFARMRKRLDTFTISAIVSGRLTRQQRTFARN